MMLTNGEVQRTGAMECNEYRFKIVPALSYLYYFEYSAEHFWYVIVSIPSTAVQLEKTYLFVRRIPLRV